MEYFFFKFTLQWYLLFFLPRIRFSWLPVTEDEEEAPHVYGYLCDLIQANHPIVLGANNSNLPRIVAIIAEALYRDMIEPTSEVGRRMLEIVKPSVSIPNVWNNLSADQKSVLQFRQPASGNELGIPSPSSLDLRWSSTTDSRNSQLSLESREIALGTSSSSEIENVSISPESPASSHPPRSPVQGATNLEMNLQEILRSLNNLIIEMSPFLKNIAETMSSVLYDHTSITQNRVETIKESTKAIFELAKKFRVICADSSVPYPKKTPVQNKLLQRQLSAEINTAIANITTCIAGITANISSEELYNISGMILSFSEYADGLAQHLGIGDQQRYLKKKDSLLISCLKRNTKLLCTQEPRSYRSFRFKADQKTIQS